MRRGRGARAREEPLAGQRRQGQTCSRASSAELVPLGPPRPRAARAMRVEGQGGAGYERVESPGEANMRRRGKAKARRLMYTEARWRPSI